MKQLYKVKFRIRNSESAGTLVLESGTGSEALYQLLRQGTIKQNELHDVVILSIQRV